MDERTEGDYAAGAFLDEETARQALQRAQSFVARIEQVLQEVGEK
jgi:uncharacterized protein (UPF0332 family)